MTNNPISSGISTYLIYGDESTYGTAGTVDQQFGLVQSSRIRMSNNIQEQYGFSDGAVTGREPYDLTQGTFEVEADVEFEPVRWSWMEYVLGSVSGSGTSGSPFVYVAGDTPPSITVSSNWNNVTTDRELALLGGMVRTCTITAATGNPVTVSLNIVGADVDKDATLTSNVALPTGEDVYNFVGGSVEIPNASALPNIIDSVTITITNEVSIEYGLGSIIGQHGLAHTVSYRVSCTLKYVDETVIELFLGGSSGPVGASANATAGFKFTNGATKSIDFVFGVNKLGEFSTREELRAAVLEEFELVAETVTVTEIQTAA